MFKKALFAAIGLALLVFVSPAIASGTWIFEDYFPPLTFKQPGDPQTPGLWYINDGDFHEGSYQYYKHCADSSCIKTKVENDVWYLQTEMYHDETPGNYVNMEASELQTGYVYGKGYETTHPTAGNPVTVEARIRCSSCNLDGTGGQVGSWGLWEWNSYPEVQPDGSFSGHPITALGFGWVQAGGILPGGLNINVFWNNYPLLFQPVSIPGGLDLTQWHSYKFTWEEASDGTNTVTYFVDGNQVGQTFIPAFFPLPSLSETLWHDNQLPTGFDPATGRITTTLQNPAVTQRVEVDYISVTK